VYVTGVRVTDARFQPAHFGGGRQEVGVELELLFLERAVEFAAEDLAHHGLAATGCAGA
jgi:hypothetical protein